MAIARYRTRTVSPWQQLDEMNNRLARLFNESEMGSRLFTGASNGGDWIPAVNVEETRDEVILSAELPGMNRDQVELEIENNVLTISGAKEETRRDAGRDEGTEDRRYHIWERRWGSFQRSFTLPRTVRAEEISANFKDGVLEVRMPKVAEAKGRKIEIGTPASSGEISSGVGR
ncbi:MAG: Hsp20/alpha crystallin family protein [Gemmatimonadales bacterium]|nr:MAG: Hsp20/alpha crystallin family protein [Gemmatimonadales bacterium]